MDQTEGPGGRSRQGAVLHRACRRPRNVDRRPRNGREGVNRDDGRENFFGGKVGKNRKNEGKSEMYPIRVPYYVLIRYMMMMIIMAVMGV